MSYGKNKVAEWVTKHLDHVLPQGPYMLLLTQFSGESLMIKNMYQKAMVLEQSKDVDEVHILPIWEARNRVRKHNQKTNLRSKKQIEKT